METYSIIYKISITHDYYRDSRCKSLHLELTGDTVSILRKQRIFFCQVGEGEWILLASDSCVMPTEKLSFIIRMSNPEFMYITEDCDVLTELKRKFMYTLTVDLKNLDFVNREKNVKIVQFQARRVFWEYLFIPRSEREYNSLEVQCQGGELVFDKVTQYVFRGIHCYRCLSKVPVTLSESYNFRLHLVDVTDYGNRYLIKNLSFPVPGQMLGEQMDNMMQLMYF